jgi:hypothetical protein
VRGWLETRFRSRPTCDRWLLDVKLRLPLGLMLLSTVLAGCASGDGAAATAAGNVPSVVMSVGGSAPYSLYTHCGVLSATINGGIFYAEPALSDGSGNPPSGWGNPYDSGQMSLTSPATAEFRDSAGNSAHFARLPQGPDLAICS